jgi:hypothetical protein
VLGMRFARSAKPAAQVKSYPSPVTKTTPEKPSRTPRARALAKDQNAGRRNLPSLAV